MAVNDELGFLLDERSRLQTETERLLQELAVDASLTPPLERVFRLISSAALLVPTPPSVCHHTQAVLLRYATILPVHK